MTKNLCKIRRIRKAAFFGYPDRRYVILVDGFIKKGIKANELATLSGVTPSTVYSMLDERRRDV